MGQTTMVYGGEQYAKHINSIALLFDEGPALGLDNNNCVDSVIVSFEFRQFSEMRVAKQIFKD